MSDLRKLAQAADEAERRFKAANAGMLPSEFPVFDCIARDLAAAEYHDALNEAYRSGSLIPRSEYERVLALLAEAREAGGSVLTRGETLEMRKARTRLRNVLSRIDDALAAEPEARG